MLYVCTRMLVLKRLCCVSTQQALRGVEKSLNWHLVLNAVAVTDNSQKGGFKINGYADKKNEYMYVSLFICSYIHLFVHF